MRQSRFIFLALLFLAAATVSSAQETVTVNFATDRGAATYRASGFLHSISATQPATSLIAPVKPKLYRCAPLDCFSFYDRVTQLGAAVQPVVSDGYIFDVYTAPWPGDGGDWTRWGQVVPSFINEAKANGFNMQWDIWNEPNLGSFWGASQGQFFETWRRGYVAIRANDPTAVIVGPSVSGFDQGYLQAFLLYAKANNVLPDIVSWHEYSGGAVIPAHVQTMRAWMTANGINISRISINEMIYQSEYTNPGATVRYLAGAERAGVDSASHACWGDTGGDNCFATQSLDGILTFGGTQPRSVWWAQKGYADVTGTIVDVSPSANVDGVAGRDEALQSAAVVLGRTGGTGNVNVQFTNISSAPHLNTGGPVRVIAQRIPNSGTAALAAPTTVIDANFTVTNNQITVTLSNFGSADAYTIRLTPFQDMTPPTVLMVTASPANGATSVATNAAFAVTFSEAMNLSTISTSTVELRNTSTNALITSTVSYNATTRVATLTPSSALAQSTGYTVRVLGGTTDPRVKDAAGIALAATFTSSFTTMAADTTLPTVSSVTPANNASGVAANATVAVTFSEAMNAATISTDTIELYDTSTSALMASTVSYNATTRVATLTPIVPLINSKSYTVNIWGGPSEPDPRVKDVAGNPLAGTFASSFTTASSAVSVTVFPTSTTILTGTLNGGNAAALASNNNVYFAVNSTTSGTRTTAWYGSFSAVPSTLSNLRVNYRGNNSANCTQTVGIWRWSDSTWVQLDSRSVSSTEIAINNLAPSGTLADYVSGSGELRVRVRCTRTANFIARGELMSISYDAPVGPPPPDTTAPVRSNGAPSGTLAFGTTQTPLSLTTNENATCRYATSAGVLYDSMANLFTTTGGTAHSTLVTGLVNGGSYNFFVRCRDASSNANTNLDDYPISFAVSSQVSQSFQASVDFSTTQGFRNWSYLYGTATQMVFASPNWQGNETYLLLYPDGGHPGNSADAIRRWRAPQAGTINITGRAFDLDGGCGSGVSVSIRKNGTNLWQQAIANGNATGFNFNLTTTVVTGDNIDFVINRGADNVNYCDATGFNPTVLLTP